jgi:hypothetical protein
VTGSSSAMKDMGTGSAVWLIFKILVRSGKILELSRSRTARQCKKVGRFQRDAWGDGF